MRASYSLVILDHLGQHQTKLTGTKREFKNSGNGWHTFVSQRDLKSSTKGYCINDTLTIMAEVTLYGAMKECEQVESPLWDKNIKDIFSDSTFSDVTVIAPSSCNFNAVDTSKSESTANSRKRPCSVVESQPAEERIPAHKLILSMRSPVFRTMFSSGMAEAISNEVRIQDFDAAVVKEFVGFLYTDHCNVAALQKHPEQLLAAAVKYEVSALKTLCEKSLSSTLSLANVEHLLHLSDLYSAQLLKTSTLDFIVLHALEVAKIEGFFANLSPELTQEVVRALTGVKG